MARRWPPVFTTHSDNQERNTSERDAADEDSPVPLPVTPTTATSMTKLPAKCLSGYYSVGVGAPLPHTGTATLPRELTPSLSFLEHLTIDITVSSHAGKSRGGGCRKLFAMTVHHNKTKASWRHSHAYEDYRRLHDRVLDLMEQGHFCMAECPWLYTFLERSFPKPSHLFSLGLSSEKAIDERRGAILRTLTTLQAVLLNPSNFNCSLLSHNVATELVSFLYGESLGQQPDTVAKMASPVHPWETESPLATTVRGFSTSLASSDGVDRSSSLSDNQEEIAMEEGEGEGEEERHRLRVDSVCCSRCALHSSNYPRRHVLAAWRSKAKEPRRRSSSAATATLSQVTETPRDSLVMTAPLTAPQTPPGSPPPEDAVYSPPRRFQLTKTPVKRLSLGATAVGVLQSLRHRVGTQSNGSFVI